MQGQGERLVPCAWHTRQGRNYLCNKLLTFVSFCTPSFVFSSPQLEPFFLTSFFSNSCQRLSAQPLSFDTPANAPGVPVTRSPHACAILGHSLPRASTHVLLFQVLAHSFHPLPRTQFARGRCFPYFLTSLLPYFAFGNFSSHPFVLLYNCPVLGPFWANGGHTLGRFF